MSGYSYRMFSDYISLFNTPSWWDYYLFIQIQIIHNYKENFKTSFIYRPFIDHVASCFMMYFSSLEWKATKPSLPSHDYLS